MNRLSTLLACFLSISAVLLCVSAGHAASSYKFCGRWGYTFVDQGLNEDYLVHESGQTFGVKAAAYSWGLVYRNGTIVWSGYMDSSGCTAVLPGTAGTYDFWVTTELRATNGGIVSITPNDTKQWRWFLANRQLNTARSGLTLARGWLEHSGAPVEVARARAHLATAGVSSVRLDCSRRHSAERRGCSRRWRWHGWIGYPRGSRHDGSRRWSRRGF